MTITVFHFLLFLRRGLRSPPTYSSSSIIKNEDSSGSRLSHTQVPHESGSVRNTRLDRRGVNLLRPHSSFQYTLTQSWSSRVNSGKRNPISSFQTYPVTLSLGGTTVPGTSSRGRETGGSDTLRTGDRSSKHCGCERYRVKGRLVSH